MHISNGNFKINNGLVEINWNINEIDIQEEINYRHAVLNNSGSGDKKNSS